MEQVQTNALAVQALARYLSPPLPQQSQLYLVWMPGCVHIKLFTNFLGHLTHHRHQACRWTQGRTTSWRLNLKPILAIWHTALTELTSYPWWKLSRTRLLWYYHTDKWIHTLASQRPTKRQFRRDYSLLPKVCVQPLDIEPPDHLYPSASITDHGKAVNLSFTIRVSFFFSRKKKILDSLRLILSYLNDWLAYMDFEIDQVELLLSSDVRKAPRPDIIRPHSKGVCKWTGQVTCHSLQERHPQAKLPRWWLFIRKTTECYPKIMGRSHFCQGSGCYAPW